MAPALAYIQQPGATKETQRPCDLFYCLHKQAANPRSAKEGQTASHK